MRWYCGADPVTDYRDGAFTTATLRLVAATLTLGHEEREERPEEHVVDLEEIARPDVGGVVAEEGGPGLTMRSWRPRLPHVPLHGPFGDLDADFEQFAADALGAPQSVVGRHVLAEADRLGRDLRVA